MPMISDLFVFTCLLYLFMNCSLSVAISQITGATEVEKGDKAVQKHLGKDTNVATVSHFDHNDNQKANDNKEDNSQSISIPLSLGSGKENSGSDFSRKYNENVQQIAMEGGDIVQQQSTLANLNQVGTTSLAIDNGGHTKGSKGRKGVLEQLPSVFPRKGVGLDESRIGDSPSSNNSSISEIHVHQLDNKDATVSIITENPKLSNSTEQLNNEQSQSVDRNISSQKIPHTKKHKLLFDDGEEFNNYSMIKTSTTGEDYVIIGVVIVIGIWFSVFGALIFYRRAGEYWDRRHYRRMDFLVEGMYND